MLAHSKMKLGVTPWTRMSWKRSCQLASHRAGWLSDNFMACQRQSKVDWAVVSRKGLLGRRPPELSTTWDPGWSKCEGFFMCSKFSISIPTGPLVASGRRLDRPAAVKKRIRARDNHLSTHTALKVTMVTWAVMHCHSSTDHQWI